MEMAQYIAIMNNINEKKLTNSLKYIKKVINNVNSYYGLPEEVKSLISKEKGNGY